MTIEQLLEEEKEKIISEASNKTRNKRRQKKEIYKSNSASEVVELSPDVKRKLRKHKHLDWQDDGGKKFKPGRERTVAAVRNLCRKKGMSLGTGEIRDYIYDMFVKWENKDKDADWMLKLEDIAKKKFSYNPRKYAHINKGDTVGLGGPGQPEYAGRAYFFTCLINGFANHFLGRKSINKYKPINSKRKQHKKEVKIRKAKERESKS